MVLDLDGRDFAGREALLRARQEGRQRRTIGLVLDGAPVPVMEEFWPVRAGDEEVGVARWAVWSYALERNIAIALVDADVPDEAAFAVDAPDAVRTGTAHPVPFVP